MITVLSQYTNVDSNEICQLQDSQNTENYLAFLNNYIEKRSLQAFYPHGSETLVSIAKQADSLVKSVHPKFVQSPEVAMDMSLLALYRIVLLLGMLLSRSLLSKANPHDS